jgi:WhiB family redox-sensing transcriptional regulator
VNPYSATRIFGEHSEPDCAEGPRWQDAALCAQVDPDRWYPEKGGSVREPVSVCRQCPVRAECLEYALENNEGYGVWGGMSEYARRYLRRTFGSDTAAAVASVIPSASPAQQPQKAAA